MEPFKWVFVAPFQLVSNNESSRLKSTPMKPVPKELGWILTSLRWVCSNFSPYGIIRQRSIITNTIQMILGTQVFKNALRVCYTRHFFVQRRKRSFLSQKYTVVFTTLHCPILYCIYCKVNLKILYFLDIFPVKLIHFSSHLQLLSLLFSCSLFYFHLFLFVFIWLQSLSAFLPTIPNFFPFSFSQSK